ncbi:MAG TPA: UPF0236 family protein [Actinomycetota bacterium]|nr:UPF0236 family protein [Actinomycetota bacterium]
MQVSVSLTVQVPSTATIEEIEEACVAASRRAGREAMGEIIGRMERARGRRARRSGGGRRRTILTRCGYLTITRGRARRADGTRFFPLDERLGLAPHHEASPAVRRRGCELAAEHPYREAARLLSREVGAQVDHRAIWRWVQADGDAKLRERAERVQAMFGDGEAPPAPDRPVPEHLTVAVDATGIRLLEGQGSVKLAVCFTRTEQLTGSRRALADRHVFADICEPDPFGQALAYELERTYGAHRIERCLLLADGEAWIKNLAGDWLPTARYQCDHWHLAVRIREFCSREERRFRRMLERAFASPHRLAAQLAAGRWKGDPERARELATYLTNNGDHLHTYRAMGPGSWMHGSAPAEKHIELTVNRRFKRRGMRWSRDGARRLLAIRLEVIAAR